MIKLTNLLNESKYRGNVLADVIEDIIKDEDFKYVDRVEDSRMNNTTYIYLTTRDMKSASEIMKTLKGKYGIKNVGYSKTHVAVTVPSGTLMEANYEIYHRSTTDALNTVLKYVGKKGYTVDQDEWDMEVTTGGASGRARPSVGKTNKFNVSLLKNGKKTRKQIHFQIYGMSSGKYELNMYIS